MELADIDLLDRDRFTQGIPHEWFTYLRANAPVYKHPEPDGPGFWVITQARRRHHVQPGRRHVLLRRRHGAASSASRSEWHAQTEAEAGRRQPHALDGPAGPHPVPQAREPRLHPADDRPARAAHPRAHRPGPRRGAWRRATRCDFVVDVAAELPLEVIAELIGVPSDDRHKIFEWSNRMIGSEDPEYIGDRRGGVPGPGRDVHVRPAAGRAATRATRSTTSSPRC